MARRIRTIKPEILSDPKTGSLGDAEFRTFVSLIVMADDYGCMEENPTQMGSEIFWAGLEEDPPVIRPIRKYLSTLEEAGLIERYEANGRKYIHLGGWEKNQKVDRPSARRIPEPPSAQRCATEDTSHNVGGDPTEAHKDPPQRREPSPKVRGTLGEPSTHPREPSTHPREPSTHPREPSTHPREPSRALDASSTHSDAGKIPPVAESPRLPAHREPEQKAHREPTDVLRNAKQGGITNSLRNDVERGENTANSGVVDEPSTHPREGSRGLARVSRGLDADLDLDLDLQKNNQNPNILGDLSGGGALARPRNGVAAPGDVGDAMCASLIGQEGEPIPQQGATTPTISSPAGAPHEEATKPSTKPKRPKGEPSPKGSAAAAVSAAVEGSPGAPNGLPATPLAEKPSTPGRGLSGAANAMQGFLTQNPDEPGGKRWLDHILSTVAEASHRTLLPTFPKALLPRAVATLKHLWEMDFRIPEWAAFGEWLVDGGDDGQGGLGKTAPSWEWMLREEGRLESLASQSKFWAHQMSQIRGEPLDLKEEGRKVREAREYFEKQEAFVRSAEGIAHHKWISGMVAKYKKDHGLDKPAPQNRADAQVQEDAESRARQAKRRYEDGVFIAGEIFCNFRDEVGDEAAKEALEGPGIGDRFAAYLLREENARSTARYNLLSLPKEELARGIRASEETRKPRVDKEGNKA